MTSGSVLFCTLICIAYSGAVCVPGLNTSGRDIPLRCIEHPASISCAGVGDDSLVPHPYDCQLFYYCLDGTSVCRQCPAGLHFSPTKHVCSDPGESGCVESSTTAEAA